MDPFVTTLTGLTVSEVLTAVLVLITAYYAWQTRRSVQAMERQNERLIRPYITVRPIRDAHMYYLQIANTGKTAAENLRLEIDKDFHCNGDEENNLAEQHLFKEGTQSFAPGAEVNHLLGLRGKIHGEKENFQMPTRFEVTAHYSYDGKDMTETTIVDFEQFPKIATPRIGIGREIRKIRKAIE